MNQSTNEWTSPFLLVVGHIGFCLVCKKAAVGGQWLVVSEDDEGRTQRIVHLACFASNPKAVPRMEAPAPSQQAPKVAPELPKCPKCEADLWPARDDDADVAEGFKWLWRCQSLKGWCSDYKPGAALEPKKEGDE